MAHPAQPPGRRAFTAFLAALPALAAVKPETRLPSDRKRYADPATEFEVLRLTDPGYTSILPVSRNRPVSRGGDALLYASDRDGTLQALRMDLKSGESAVLTSAKSMQPWSLTMLPGERALCYFDGGALTLMNLSNRKTHVVYEVPAGQECVSLSVSEDGMHAFLVEAKGVGSRLRLIPLMRGAATTVVESDGRLLDPRPRPKRAGILYRRDDATLWLVNYDGQQNRKLRVGAGRVVRALWSPDGRTVLYLSIQEEPKRIHAIRECTPDTNADSLVALTTQFADFERNPDASVFVGVCGSLAQPHILLLVRQVKREFTLCEHKSSDARAVAAQFSSNSQRIFFQSDRHGKPAIYSMAIEKLVEQTMSE